MLYLRLIILTMGTFSCRKAPNAPETISEPPSMITSHCVFDLEYCPPPGSTKGEYEAAHSALEDCLTGCMDTNQAEERTNEEVWKGCALICDQYSYLDLIPTPTSFDIQVLE